MPFSLTLWYVAKPNKILLKCDMTYPYPQHSFLTPCKGGSVFNYIVGDEIVMCVLTMSPQSCHSWTIGATAWQPHSVMKLGHQAGNNGCEHLSDGRVWCSGGSQGAYNSHRNHIEIYNGVDWDISVHTLPIKMAFHHATEIQPGVLLLSGGYGTWGSLNPDVSHGVRKSR